MVQDDAAAVWVDVATLTPWVNNPRRNDHAVDSVAKSIERFGFAAPIIARKDNGEVIAGHTRLKAAIKLGLGKVPVRYLDLDEQEAHALAIADNKLNEIAEWDEESLSLILSDISEGGVSLDGIGFDDKEIQSVLVSAHQRRIGDPAADPGPQMELADELQRKWKTQSGQLWEISSNTVSGMSHTIFCGDATKHDDVELLMSNENAMLCWTDPPWNINYGASGSSGWRKQQRVIANDNLGDKFPAFCSSFSEEINNVLEPGAALYLAMAAQEWTVLHSVLHSAGFHWSSTIIWKKDRLVLSRKDYHTQFEPIWYGWKDGAPRLCPVADRTQTDVWEIDRPSRSVEHPTMKPVELVARAIRNSSRPRDIVYDPFSGSGTTLVASEQTGRICRAMELEPKYVAVALERMTSMGLNCVMK
jgi:DNA modification methylase